MYILSAREVDILPYRMSSRFEIFLLLSVYKSDTVR